MSRQRRREALWLTDRRPAARMPTSRPPAGPRCLSSGTTPRSPIWLIREAPADDLALVEARGRAGSARAEEGNAGSEPRIVAPVAAHGDRRSVGVLAPARPCDRPRERCRAGGRARGG